MCRGHGGQSVRLSAADAAGRRDVSGHDAVVETLLLLLQVYVTQHQQQPLALPRLKGPGGVGVVAVVAAAVVGGGGRAEVAFRLLGGVDEVVLVLRGAWRQVGRID